MQNKKIVVISLIVLIGLFAVAMSMFKSSESKQIASNVKENYSSLVRDHSYVKGNPDAKVELVEFFDPACGTCAMFGPYVRDIMKKNKGKIKLVYRYAPFHKNSDKIVKLLEASRNQNKFEEVLRLLFVTQRYWVKHHVAQPDIAWQIILNSKLVDMNKLSQDISNPDYNDILEQDQKDAQTLNVTKTPSYFVNGKPLETFGLEQLTDLINSEL